MTRRRTVLVSLALAVAAMAAAVASAAAGTGWRSASPRAEAFTVDEARHYVADFYKALAASNDVTRGPARSLDELLPNVTFQRSDGTATTLGDTVVVGRITAVERGDGFVVEGADGPGGTPAAYDDARARWRSIHATFAVDRVIGAKDPQPPSTVQLWLNSPRPQEFDKVKAGLLSLGQVVAFLLRPPHPLTAHRSDLWLPMSTQGAMLLPVASDGTLSAPLMAPDWGAEMLGGGTTLAQLEQQAKVPRSVLLVPADGGGWRRADGR